MKKAKNAFLWLCGIFALLPLGGVGGGLLGLLSSCDSDSLSDDSYYTFTGETVASYVENRPDSFAVFSQIVKDAGENALLSTYGHYTAFIPTDMAFQAFFREHGTTVEQLTAEEKRNIVYNHIIRSTSLDYATKDFQEGALPVTNMNGRFMVIAYERNEQADRNDIVVNQTGRIVAPDIEVHNGIIHAINHVLVPSDETLGALLDQMADYSLFAEALRLTHLCDSMAETYDVTFQNPFTSEFVNVLGYKMKTLQQRRLGYTVLAEPDEVLRSAGISSLEELRRFAEGYYGIEAASDPTDRRNALNRFVSYHLLDRQMATNSLIYQGKNTSASAMDKRYEYYETMLENRLIEVKAGNKINTRRNGQYVGLDESRSNVSGMNGFIHSLTSVLVYDEDVMQQDVLNKRIRFDDYSVAPELTNNNIRWNLTNLDGFGGYTMAPDYCGDHLRFNNDSKIIMWASEWWTAHQADEISVRGWYDFTMRMPPVPPGTYEIRLGYRAEPWRGIAQLFIDGQIIGIPVDLSYTGDMPQIGWVSDDETTDQGAENDKMMRNRGYMKAPNSIFTQNGNINLRQDINSLRIIIGTFTFQNYAPHYFRAKNVDSENGEFTMDYMEYVPVSYIDQEGKD